MPTDLLKDAFLLIGTASSTLWAISVSFMIYFAQESRKKENTFAADGAWYVAGIANCFLLAMLSSILNLIPKEFWDSARVAVYTGVGSAVFTGLFMSFFRETINLFSSSARRGFSTIFGRLFNAVSYSVLQMIGPLLFLSSYFKRDIGVGFAMGMLSIGCAVALLISVTLPALPFITLKHESDSAASISAGDDEREARTSRDVS